MITNKFKILTFNEKGNSIDSEIICRELNFIQQEIDNLEYLLKSCRETYENS